MRRVSVTSALTVVGVLAAGIAAALVNTRVLDSAEGGAVQANPVQLVEPEVWQGPPMASPWSTTTAAAPTTTTTTTAAPVFADDGVGDVDATSAVNDHDDTDPATGRSRARPPADPDATTATATATSTSPATMPSADELMTGTFPPPYPPSTTPTPSTAVPTTTSSSTPPTSRPSVPSTTAPTTTAPPDD